MVTDVNLNNLILNVPTHYKILIVKEKIYVKIKLWKPDIKDNYIKLRKINYDKA